MRLPVRQPVTGVRPVGRTQRAALPWLARPVGVALIVGSGAALYWLTTANQFRVDPQAVQISGLAYTDEQQVRQQIGLTGDARPNVFRLHAAAMAEALRSLPSVQSAEIVVALPNQVEVRVVERQPLIIWRTDVGAFLTDATGALIAQDFTATGLPTVFDGRSTAKSLTVGGRLDDVDMAAARLLLTITPSDIGSRATTLSLSVDDNDGFALLSDYPSWRAVFGFYTANLRQPADLVPRQRQCLASILAGGEDRLEVVYLAVAGDSCGTYRDRPTPSALFSQNVGQPKA